MYTQKRRKETPIDSTGTVVHSCNSIEYRTRPVLPKVNFVTTGHRKIMEKNLKNN